MDEYAQAGGIRGLARPELHVRRERASRVVLVMPALDEEEALPLVLDELPRGLFERVIVVDNGSTDRTAAVARERGATVVVESAKGYGNACQAGIAEALVGDERHPPLEDRDVLAFCDADHSDYPEDLGCVVGPVLAGRADFVIGSRILGGADRRALLPQAWFGNRFACFLMRLLFGLRHTDLGPMRAIEVGALRHLQMGDRTFGWTIEMQLKAHAARLRTLEVPVRYRPRTGVSKITGTLSGTLGAGYKILGWIVSWRLRSLRARDRIPSYR
ncbi:MAG: glycosyltransferase family 2 protein [Planctomycetota bacterium]|jgi:glycosyltransferase involved in cell wall biosynthesis